MLLDEVRREIDMVDAGIKESFKKRMELAEQVAIVKSENSDDIFKPEREKQIIENLTGDVSEDIVMEYTALLKRVMEISRKYQYKKTMELVDGLAHEYISESKPLNKAVMLKPELYICSGDISKDIVTTVDSYDQMGLLVENGSADAGIAISEEVGRDVMAGLHTLLCEKGLFINRCDVVNDSGVKKKVVTFSKDFVVRENDNRMKIMFICQNREGSLAGILSMIADYGVNLTEIHSRPNRKKDWNYEFYAELLANYGREDIQALVYQLENETDEFRILGSYECEGDFNSLRSE